MAGDVWGGGGTKWEVGAENWAAAMGGGWRWEKGGLLVGGVMGVWGMAVESGGGTRLGVS